MKTIEVGTFDAKNRLSELLGEVGRGRKVFITRRGKRVAVLASPDDDERAMKTRKPSDILVACRELRAKSSTGRHTIKDLIEEGRR